MTNRSIVNPYVRCFLAHELLGLRRVYWRSIKSQHGYDLLTATNEARNMAARMATHLTRHGAEMLQGNPAPLALYPASFAGH